MLPHQFRSAHEPGRAGFLSYHRPESSVQVLLQASLQVRQEAAAPALHHDPGRAAGASLASLATEPVSPALCCVVTLTVFFFSVYLTVILVRLAKTIALGGGARQKAEKREGVGAHFILCEEALAETDETLVHVPMLCILFIAARVRAMQLEPLAGDPAHWMQLCMYVGTGAFFVRFLFDLGSVLAGTKEYPQLHRVVSTLSSLTSITVYAASGAIIAGMLLSIYEEPSFPPTLWCVAILCATHFAEFLVVEIAQICLGRAAVFRAQEEQIMGGVEAVLQQFPSMLCVLLLAMTLRIVQLGLLLPQWVVGGIMLSTAAVMFQAILAVVSILLVASGQTAPLKDRGGSGSRVASVCQVVLLLCFCCGATISLVGVFAMEKDPVTELRPQTIDHGEWHRADSGRALSTTMRVVMLITLLYFVVKLGLLAAGSTCGKMRDWAVSALLAVQGDLAFAPMLCVLMVAVRLRAMHLRMRDPQPWAQTAMYSAVYCALCHVSCSLLCPLVSAGDRNIDAKDMGLCSKALIIALLAVRYIASMTLFVAVAMLIVALLSMDS